MIEPLCIVKKKDDIFELKEANIDIAADAAVNGPGRALSNKPETLNITRIFHTSQAAYRRFFYA